MVDGQQMFMLFFSILYGIMLNSVLGLRAFPWGFALAGEDLVWKGNGQSGPKSRRRLLLSIALINALPFAYFGFAFHFMSELSQFFGKVLSTCLFCTVVKVVFIGFLSLGVFAFLRIYIAMVTWRYRGDYLFYTKYEYDKYIRKRYIHPYLCKHLCAGLIHLIPFLMLLFLWILFCCTN